MPSRLHGSRSVHRQRCLHLQRDFLRRCLRSCELALPSSVQRPRLMQRGRLHLRHWLWRRRLLGRPPRLPAQLRRPRNVLAGPCACDPGRRATARWRSERLPENCSGRRCCSADVGATRFAARLVTNPCRLRVAQLHALAEARARRRLPVPARLRSRLRACDGAARVPIQLLGRGACLDGVCRCHRDGPGARATASSQTSALTWAARLRARPTASTRERSHRAAHVLVRARFRGAACDVALRWCPSDCSNRGEYRALALRGAPADSPLPGLAQLLRAMHAGRDARPLPPRSIRYKYSRPHSSRRSRPARRRRHTRLAACASAAPARRGRRAPTASPPPKRLPGRGCRAAGCVCEAASAARLRDRVWPGEMERMRVGVILRPCVWVCEKCK